MSTNNAISETDNTNVASANENWSGIDSQFYSETFDHHQYLWSIMPSDASADWLERTTHFYESALEKVDAQLSQRVLQSYNDFVTAMNMIQSLNDNLTTTSSMTRESRISITSAKDQIAIASLRIVALYNKRLRLRAILELMLKVKKLQQYRQSMRLALKEGSYPAAISYCSNCREIVKSTQQITCIAKMAPIIREDYSTLQRNLSSALLDCCRSKFNASSYESVIKALCMIYNMQTILELHQKHFMSAIKKAAKQVVLTHILLGSKHNMNAEGLQKMSYKTLCKRIQADQFPACINLMLEQFSDTIFCFHAMLQWLIRNDIELSSNVQSASIVKLFYPLVEGLNRFRKVFWENGMQQRILMLFSNVDISSLPVYHFLQLVNSINSFIVIGEEFIGAPAHKLRDELHTVSSKYFNDFHKAKLDELCQVLESEIWSPVPVHKSFAPRDIPEVKRVLEDATVRLPRHYVRRSLSFFVRYELSGNPFAPENITKQATHSGAQHFDIAKLVAAEEGPVDPALLASTIEEIDELTNKSVPQQTTNVCEGSPLIANSTLSLLRAMALYIEFMKPLEDLSFTIFTSLVSLVEYYVFTVYSFFGLSTNTPQTRFGPTILNLLRRVEATLTPNMPDAETTSSSNNSETPMKKCELNPSLAGNVLQQVIPSVVSAESMHFLHQSLLGLKSTIYGLMPINLIKRVDEFYDRLVQQLPCIRELLYKGMANKVFSTEKVIMAAAQIDWASPDIPSTHNPYIDELMRELSSFAQKLTTLTRKQIITQAVAASMWEFCCLHAVECLVEGWSRANECSPEGRATMSLDMNVLQAKLTGPMSFAKKAAHIAETYIRAYYLPESESLAFIKQHLSVFTKQQLLRLIEVSPWPRKAKLLAEDLIFESLSYA